MKRNFSPWAYWRIHLDTVVAADPCPGESAQAIQTWQARARPRLAGLLGPWPEPVDLAVEVLDEEAVGGHRRLRIVFDAEAVMSVPALLLVPDDRTAAHSGVLAIHGHGDTKDTICAPGGYAHGLATRGHVVLAPDLRGFGERADPQPDDRYQCDVNLVHAYAAGMNPMGQNLWDLARCLDVLAAHPLVDPGRLGVAGWSYGGTLALFLAAWDERVAATAVSCYFSSFAAAHAVPWNLCGSQVLPGMLGAFEHTDVGALIAPRPLLVSSGTDDFLFPVGAARESIARLQDVYGALGAAGAVAHDVFAGGHEWHAEPIEAFLDDWLR